MGGAEQRKSDAKQTRRAPGAHHFIRDGYFQTSHRRQARRKLVLG
jgi:hypothetical protein